MLHLPALHALIAAYSALGMTIDPLDAQRLLRNEDHRAAVIGDFVPELAIFPGISAVPLMAFGGKKAPVGSYFLTGSVGASATDTFSVPLNVNLLCGVVIGGGGGGGNGGFSSRGAGGGGGALSYSNDIPVTPGEPLSIFAGQGGAAYQGGQQSYVMRGSTRLLYADSGSRGTNGGSGTAHGTAGDGGSASHSQAAGDVRFSGGSGTNNTSRAGGGTALWDRDATAADRGLGTSPFGPAFSGTTGRGGTGGNTGNGSGSAGGVGAVRLFWGPGYSQPDNILPPG